MKSGDRLEISLGGRPYESKILVNGEDVAGMVHDVFIESSADSITKVKLGFLSLNECLEVSGRVVVDKDWDEFAEWKATRDS